MKTVNEILDSKQIYSQGLDFSEDGIKGYMCIDRVDMSFIASWGGGWDHVSVAPLKKKITPSWEMMCKVKDIFFYDDEAVIQIHPPKKNYVNNRSNCLHLWRPLDYELILPPSFMVGLTDGQSIEDIKKEVIKYYEERGYAE